MALEFYKMMQTEGAGGKITKIELVDLTPEDVKKASEVQTGPDGKKAQLPLKPTKKLMITVETKDANGSSSSSSENFVAETDGKYVIPVPADVKQSEITVLQHVPWRRVNWDVFSFAPPAGHQPPQEPD